MAQEEELIHYLSLSLNDKGNESLNSKKALNLLDLVLGGIWPFLSCGSVGQLLVAA